MLPWIPKGSGRNDVPRRHFDRYLSVVLARVSKLGYMKHISASKFCGITQFRTYPKCRKRPFIIPYSVRILRPWYFLANRRPFSPWPLHSLKLAFEYIPWEKNVPRYHSLRGPEISTISFWFDIEMYLLFIMSFKLHVILSHFCVNYLCRHKCPIHLRGNYLTFITVLEDSNYIAVQQVYVSDYTFSNEMLLFSNIFRFYLYTFCLRSAFGRNWGKVSSYAIFKTIGSTGSTKFDRNLKALQRFNFLRH